MKIRSTCLAAAVAATLTSSVAVAQGFESPDAIDRQVAAFLGMSPDRAGAAFIPVDRRLRLQTCSSSLDLAWYGSRRETVLVRCPQPGSWKLYVRVSGAQGTAAPTAPASPVIRRGDAVTVTLRGTGFSVSQSAEALENGAVGEWIRVSIGKRSEMRAQVLQPGSVGMDMP